ncbi:LysR family transcriptional regulator [Thalassotalea euphylliae]|uniref:LysR family transcriptional regulator n=1 Tax=Thalassotalea euphylliae TaxID=1655234 RepID=A0A3E0U2J8_9GAMM|nr:LysR family transcriptional regulator [Thalassotalea euphylliae]
MLAGTKNYTQQAFDVIDISDIHMIKVISEVGSINKAAELLSVSQPTLSKKVSRLEQKINMELFFRDSAGMIPTETARLLLRKGDELKSQLDIIERQLELMANLVGGTVRVGVGPIIEQDILPKALLDFAEQDYKFKISVVTMSSEGLLDALKKSQIDIAIGPFAANDVPNEFITPFMNYDKLVAAVRKDHELAKEKNVSLEVLMKYKSITPNIPKSLGSQVTDLLRGRPLDPMIICDNYNMAKTIVANSDYVTAGPETLFHKEFASGELVKLDFQTEVFWQCRCLLKPENLLIPVVKEVVELFSQYMLAEGGDDS